MIDTTRKSPAAEPIKVLASVIQGELGLADGRIMLGLENWEIPKTQELYVALLYGATVVAGNNCRTDTDQDGNFVEVTETVLNQEISVDLMSFGDEARLRQGEVLMALSSQAAQDAAEKYQMRINTEPTGFVSVPSSEESKLLNRFRINVVTESLYRKVRRSSYYDSLQTPAVTPDA